MYDFKFKGVSKNGQIVKDILRAPNIIAAGDLIKAKEINLIKIKESLTSLIYRKYVKLNMDEIISLVDIFYLSFSSALPLKHALDNSKKNVSKKLFKVIKNLGTDLAYSHSLSDALIKQKNVFPPYFIPIIQATEESGDSAKALFTLRSTLNKEKEILSELKSLFIYPSVLFLLVMAAFYVITTIVLPIFNKLIVEFGGSVFWLFAWLGEMGVEVKKDPQSHFLGLFAIIVVIFIAYKSLIKISLLIDYFKIKIPIIGSLILNKEQLLFFSYFNLLVSTSVPFVKIFPLLRYIAGNSLLKREIDKIDAKLNRGQTLSEAMGPMKFIDEKLLHILNFSELSGALKDGLDKICKYLEIKISMDSKKAATKLNIATLAIIFIMLFSVTMMFFMSYFDYLGVLNEEADKFLSN